MPCSLNRHRFRARPYLFLEQFMYAFLWIGCLRLVPFGQELAPLALGQDVQAIHNALAPCSHSFEDATPIFHETLDGLAFKESRGVLHATGDPLARLPQRCS